MDALLKKECLAKIKEVYPFCMDDAILLVGSRATGLALKDSDVDVIILTKKLKQYERQSISKNFRKPGEDPGLEFWIRKNILLEVKIKKYSVPKKDINFFDAILNSETWQSSKELKTYKKKISEMFEDIYEDELMRNYVGFFENFKEMEGIIKRKENLSSFAFEMKKGISLQSLLRLLLIVQEKTYPSDKFLFHRVNSTKLGREAKELIVELRKIKTEKQLFSFKNKIRIFLTMKMPKRHYVGVWWKHLKKYKEL